MNAPLRTTETDIQAAVACIPAHDRDVWVKVGMAIKSELGEGGFVLWDAWSQSADNYDAKAARSVWKSAKPGKVTIRSLFFEAMRCGWESSTPYEPPTPEQRAIIEAEQQAAAAEAAEMQRQHRAEAAEKANTLWNVARDVEASNPYLHAKGIKPEGIKQLKQSLVLPLRAGGELVNLQFIGEDGSKRFLTGGQVRGACLVLGKLKDADEALLCEGWATACSLREAIGKPVVVAFNAGNLPVIAERLGLAFPGMALRVCGDTDASQTGQRAAQKAATLHGLASWCSPTFTDAQREQHQQAGRGEPSDYNDLHQLAGLDAVRTAVDTAVMTNLPEIDGNSGNNGNISVEPNQDKASCRPRLFPEAENTDGNNGNKPKKEVGYKLIHGGPRPGLYWLDPDGEKPKRWVCSPIAVEAKTRDEKGGNWGRLLSWRDAEGRPHRWAMPSELTCGDGSELARELSRGGLDIDPTRRARELLIAYLVKAETTRLVRSTGKTGWHGNAFVLHDEVVGDNHGEGVFLQTDRDESMGMTQAGSVASWREQVGMLAAGNSRLVFVASLAFASPLAEAADESGGFHLMGRSSTGKSTGLEVAASVWGSPNDYGFKWRATSNGVEGICAGRNHLLVILDELAQVDPREAGETVYLIANQQGKARSDRSGAIRTPKRWRVLLLSAGEISLSQHMQEAGKQTRAGQEIRLADINADAGAGLGLFDTLHGELSGAALSQRIKHACAQHHGTAGRAFLAQLVANRAAVHSLIKQGRDSFIAEDVPPGASGQVLRVAGRFALVATAGELATAWGLTGWQEGEAIRAAARLFGEWLAQRGGAGDSETREGLATVRGFLEAHGESRFTPWDADQATAARTINRAGFKRETSDGVYFYVLPNAFKKELCKGFNHAHIAKAMLARGWLKGQAADRTTYKARLPGMGESPSSVYLIAPAIWGDE